MSLASKPKKAARAVRWLPTTLSAHRHWDASGSHQGRPGHECSSAPRPVRWHRLGRPRPQSASLARSGSFAPHTDFLAGGEPRRVTCKYAQESTPNTVVEEKIHVSRNPSKPLAGGCWRGRSRHGLCLPVDFAFASLAAFDSVLSQAHEHNSAVMVDVSPST